MRDETAFHGDNHGLGRAASAAGVASLAALAAWTGALPWVLGWVAACAVAAALLLRRGEAAAPAAVAPGSALALAAALAPVLVDGPPPFREMASLALVGGMVAAVVLVRRRSAHPTVAPWSTGAGSGPAAVPSRGGAGA